MYALIINPQAGKGKGSRILPEIEALLEKEGIDFTTYMANVYGDSRKFAAMAVEKGYEGVIAVGGDGTLFEIINGLGPSGLTVLFACCGTGNDFVRSLKLPKDPIEALKLQLKAPVHPIDIGRVNETYFLNVSGTGLDVQVLVETDKYKGKYEGLGVYLRGVRDALHLYKPMHAKVSIDDGEEKETDFAILSIGNGQYFGGGMRPVPPAVVNDGFFHLVITKPVKKWMIPFLLVLFVPGWYVKTHFCRVVTCRKVRVQSEAGMTFNLDGELIPCTDAQVEIIPRAIRVRVPSLQADPQA